VSGFQDGVAYGVYWHADGDNSYWTITLNTMAPKGKIFYVTISLYANNGALIKRFPRDKFILDYNTPIETDPYYFVNGYGSLTFKYKDIEVVDR